MRSTRCLSLALALAFTAPLTACVDSPDDDEVLSETEQGLYSQWIEIPNMIVRFCRTSTRVYWQFAYNTATTVTTWGDKTSQITSNIAGISTGTKYRTHNNSTVFYIRVGPGSGTGYHIGYSIAAMPDCSWL